MGTIQQPKDISNKAVVAMLVIFILVSVLALGLYIKALNDAQPEVTYQSSDTGVATLTIAKASPEPVKDTTGTATAEATLEVLPNEKAESQ